MQQKTYRVIQWATGSIGCDQLRFIQEHPDLELVGCYVHSPEKAGQDVGEFFQDESIGIKATNDIDEILAMDADAVCYSPRELGIDPLVMIAEVSRILASGKNVVSVLINSAIPSIFGAEAQKSLEKACKIGNSSFMVSGVNPGATQDILHAVVSSTRRVDSCSINGIWNLQDFGAEGLVPLGIGLPAAEAEALDIAPIGYAMMGSQVHLVANSLNIEIDELGFEHEFSYAEEDIVLNNMTISKGCVTALKWKVMGLVNGEPKIFHRNTWWVGSYNKQWLQPPENFAGYYIAVEGDPDSRLTWVMRDNPELSPITEHPIGGENPNLCLGPVGIITAVRAVNSVPTLCDAEPGLLTVTTIPRTTTRHVNWRK